MPGGRPKTDPVKRFTAKTVEMPNGCVEWTSTIHRDGYGKFQWDGKRSEKAHRAAYMLFVGEIPEGMWVLHKCDNRKCVNPNHLFIGTNVDNIRDMDDKNRRGTKSALTYKDVENIKKMLSDGVSQQKVADQYKVHQTCISRIKLGKTTLFLKG